MALITCPCCHKRISSRVAVCPHCQYPFQGGDEERRQSRLRVEQIKRQQRFTTWQFVFLLMFVAGFALAYINPDYQPWMVPAGQVLSATGFVGYLILRVWRLVAKI